MHPAVVSGVCMLPISLFFEYGAYWDYYSSFENILHPIIIIWIILSTLFIVIPPCYLHRINDCNHTDTGTHTCTSNNYVIAIFQVIVIATVALIMNNDFLDPAYAFDMKILLFFIPPLIVPFTILSNQMWENNITLDFASYNYYTNLNDCFTDIYMDLDYQQSLMLYKILNNAVYLIVLFKLTSLFLILFICCIIIITVESMNNDNMVISILILIFCGGSIVFMLLFCQKLGKLSTQLRNVFNKHISPQRPLLPHVQNNYSYSCSYSESKKLKLTNTMGKSKVVSSISGKNINSDNMYTNRSGRRCKYSCGLAVTRMCQMTISFWRKHTFWLRHLMLILTCLLTIMTAYSKYSLETHINTSDANNIRKYAITLDQAKSALLLGIRLSIVVISFCSS